MGYKSTYPRTYAVINRDTSGYLVVALIEARGQIDAVNQRYEKLGRPNPNQGGSQIVAVSRGLPGDYGTGATRLYPVTFEPPVPVTPRVRVGTQPIRPNTLHELAPQGNDF